MERRFLLFLAVSFLIVTVWARVFTPAAPEPGGAEPAVPGVEGATDVRPEPSEAFDKEQRAMEDVPVDSPSQGPGTELAAPEVAGEARGASEEFRVVVETELLRMELTNAGARIVSAQLKAHEDAEGRPYELVARRASELVGTYPLDVRVEDDGISEALRKARFDVEGPRTLRLGPGQTGKVRFVWSDGLGLDVRKELSFDGDGYVVSVDVSVRQSGREIAKDVLVGPGLGAEVSESRYVGREKGVIVRLGGEVELFDASHVAEGEGRAEAVSTTGIASHYFAALMLPVGDEVYGALLERSSVPIEGDTRKEREVITAALRSTRGEATFHLYMGPKRLERLEALGPGLTDIIELGWMRVPALLLRSALVRIYGVVHNYGWAIVLLTLLINLLLVPLKHYSFVSMRKMQTLAPQIQHIRDKYKKVKPTDPRYQHMNQEIMTLYKEHNVNPISGCLPMVLMIPFFFAFYRLLMSSIELRHAPFLGWIVDLSAYDPMFVLPIMMGVSQVAIQRMTPQSTADPVQQKVMQFMPIMFTFILAWAPAGLVLYWFSNNLVSMGQQMVTNRYLKTQDEKTAEADKAASRSKKKVKK